MTWEERTLQNCMTSPKANQVAVCGVHSAANDLGFITWKERGIKANEDTIQAIQELIKKKAQEHQEFNQPTAGVAFHKLVKEKRTMKEMQELIKKKQENIKDLRDVIDMRKQNIVYLKQIFGGP